MCEFCKIDTENTDYIEVTILSETFIPESNMIELVLRYGCTNCGNTWYTKKEFVFHTEYQINHPMLEIPQ